MKIAGLISAILAVIVTMLLWLLPTSLTLFGTDIDCGIPAVTAFTGLEGTQGIEDDLIEGLSEQCARKSIIRGYAGLAVGALGIGGGAILFVLGTNTATDTRRNSFAAR